VLGRITRSLLLAAVGFITQYSFAQPASQPAQGQAPAAKPGAARSGQPAPEAPMPAERTTSKVTLDTSETLFTIAAALNNCGYDEDLSQSYPVRMQVRQDVARVVANSPGAQAASTEMCAFYRDHQQEDPGQNVAQYVTLALMLTEPPKIALKIKEADVPPDAAYVLGFVPLVQHFYDAAGMHQVWQRHQAEYERIIQQLQVPVTNLLLSTDIYLRIPLSGYLGRHFSIYVEPQLGPNQTNARNFGVDYFMVVSPEKGGINLEQVRHTYLHFMIDPMLMKRYLTMQKLQPLLKTVQNAPMPEYYKRDIVLLTTESLIRAVEARTLPGGKAGEPKRQEAVNKDMSEGFILTRFFYEQLVVFENESAGLQDSIGEWFYNMDLDRERKRVGQVQFAASASPEVLAAPRPKASTLDLAEQRMAAGDYNGAAKLAQQALDEKGDQGRALFVLAQAATLNRDLKGARSYYEKTIQVAKDPRLVAWSHIYLGRISDMQEEREDALAHYRAALAAGQIPAAAKAAAERGLQQPYEPSVPKQ